MPQRTGETQRAEVQADRGLPERRKRCGPWRVRQDQGRDRRKQQHDTRRDFDLEKPSEGFGEPVGNLGRQISATFMHRVEIQSEIVVKASTWIASARFPHSLGLGAPLRLSSMIRRRFREL